MKAGWEEKPLGNTVDILDRLRKPITKRNRVEGPYPYYGATGILDHVDDYIFDEPLVLLGEDGAKWGPGDASAFAIEGKCWVNNHAHVLRPVRDDLLDAFLIYFLNFTDLSDYISGMTVPKLNQGRLREITIPLPPLEEQKRIVAILDEAFECLDRAKANAEANLKSARELFENLLMTTFTPSDRAGFIETTVGAVITLQRGHDITKKEQRHGSYPVVSSGGIKSFHDEYKAEAPGVVVGRKGSIGRIHFVEDNYWPHDTTLWVKDFKGNNERLVYYMLHSLGLADLDTGAANPSLNRNLVHPLMIAWPMSENEEAVIGRLTSLETNTTKLAAAYFSKQQGLDGLRQSLLAKAFAGELT